jgi:hypothetical protein
MSGLAGRLLGGPACRLQGCIGARVASPQSSILHCSIVSLQGIDFAVNYLFILCFKLADCSGLVIPLGEPNVQNVHGFMPKIRQQPSQRPRKPVVNEEPHGTLISA